MHRDKFLNSKSGFTLVEVMVSVGILLIFLPFSASMLLNSQLLASYSKHKIQAAYLAQQLIETQRQKPFIVLTPGQSQIVPPSPAQWPLDTKGNFNNASNYFYASVVMTATPSVYTKGDGTQITSTTTDHFQVVITWPEQILNIKIPMTETYVADIANDPMLN